MKRRNRRTEILLANKHARRNAAERRRLAVRRCVRAVLAPLFRADRQRVADQMRHRADYGAIVNDAHWALEKRLSLGDRSQR